MIVIGIDPGLSGALGWIASDGRCGVVDMPTVELGGTARVNRRVQGRELILAMRAIAPAADGAHVVCERMQAMAKDRSAVSHEASVMRTFGSIEAVLDILGWQTTYVSPITWKSYFRIDKKGLGLPPSLKPQQVAKAMKDAGLALARRLYPDAELPLAKHHNRAEALLIARWGMGTLS